MMNGVKEYVESMTEIPMTIMELVNTEEVEEVTPVVCGDSVEFWCEECGSGSGVVVDKDYYCEWIKVESDKTFDVYEVHRDDLKVIHTDRFPENDCVWAFKGDEEETWAYTHYRDIAECGFRIYEVGGLIVIAAEKVRDMYGTYWNHLYKERMRGAA